MKNSKLKSEKFWVVTVARAFIAACGVVIGRLYVGPLTIGVLNLGNGFGLCVALALLLIAIFFNPLCKGIKTMRKTKKHRVLLKSFIALVIAFCILFLGTLTAVVNCSRYTATEQTTVIVLGCRIWGSTPSVALKARVRAATEYMETNPDAVAILSGGQGSDENLSEAQCMFDLMTEQGIDPQRLYIEDKSTSTDENILFSKKIIEDNRLSKDVAIATTDYHQMRANMICKKNGLQSASLPSRSGINTKATFFTREVFGVWIQWLKLLI